LDLLLKHVLERYEKAGVGYVEFSVGVGDLCRPWVSSKISKTNIFAYQILSFSLNLDILLLLLPNMTGMEKLITDF